MVWVALRLRFQVHVRLSGTGCGQVSQPQFPLLRRFVSDGMRVLRTRARHGHGVLFPTGRCGRETALSLVAVFIYLLE